MKKGNFAKRIIIYCILAATFYTIFSLFMQYTKGLAPDATLTTVVFAAVFGELWELSKIKREKLKNDNEVK